MSTTITIYLNEARGASYDGFAKKTALLVEGFTFTIERDIVPGGGKACDESIWKILEDVFTMLNVGGDLYPHNDWSRAYRATDRRSLSIGDVVHVDGAGYFTPTRMAAHTQDVADYGSIQGWPEIMGGAHWVQSGLHRHVEHFGDAGVKDGVAA